MIDTTKKVHGKILKIVLGTAAGCILSALTAIVAMGLVLFRGLAQALADPPVNTDFLGLIHVERSENAGATATIGVNGLTAFALALLAGGIAGALISWFRYRSEHKKQDGCLSP